MRAVIIGLGSAALLGASLLVLPPALATPHAAHPAALATLTAKPKPAAKDSGDDKEKGSDKDRGKGNGGDKDDKCNYPVTLATLTLSATGDDGFTGTLTKNKCMLGDRRIVIDDASGKQVGSGETTGDGAFRITVDTKKGHTYTAHFGGGSTIPPATSNSVTIK